MPNDYFKFKQFTIQQERCAMKVGTDAVLLGAWVNVAQSGQILDIGSGSGIISLMLAQRTNATIEGVEIDKDAYLQSIENAAKSPWRERIFFQNNSFQNFCLNNKSQYNLIVSNPPYFVNSLKSDNINRNIARHNDSLTFEDIIEGVSQLLAPTGRFALILPYKEGCIFIAEAVKQSLFCIRKTNIKPKPNSSISRLLLEFHQLPAPCNEDFLVIGTGEIDKYSDKYIELTKDFYLTER